PDIDSSGFIFNCTARPAGGPTGTCASDGIIDGMPRSSPASPADPEAHGSPFNEGDFSLGRDGFPSVGTERCWVGIPLPHSRKFCATAKWNTPLNTRTYR